MSAYVNMKRRFSFLLFWSALIAAPTYAQSLEEEANDIPGLEYLYELVYRDSTFGGGLRDILPEGYVTPEELKMISNEELSLELSRKNGLLSGKGDFSFRFAPSFGKQKQIDSTIVSVQTRFGSIPVFVDVIRWETVDGMIAPGIIYDITDVSVKSKPKIICAIIFLDGINNRLLPNGSLVMRRQTAASELCSSVPFRNQRNTVSGTAFALSDSSVCTAYHYGFTPNKIAFVFYYTTDDDFRDTIPANRVFLPKRVISYSTAEKNDYVVYSLDRKLPKIYSPVNVSTGIAKKGDPVYMIGHPNRWPLKISFNAKVMASRGHKIFTSLSKMNFNSGSPVFKGDTHELVGMLINGGSEDFRKTRQGCKTFFFENYSDYVASIYVPIQTILLGK
jgi:hypothetical protein